MNILKSKHIIFGGIVVTLFVAGYLIFSNLDKSTIDTSGQNMAINQERQPSTTLQIVDKQASFAIFTHGTFRVFTATMYHNLSKEVYIEASNPNIVLVRKTGVTWNDFFQPYLSNLLMNVWRLEPVKLFATDQTAR